MVTARKPALIIKRRSPGKNMRGRNLADVNAKRRKVPCSMLSPQIVNQTHAFMCFCDMFGIVITIVAKE